MCVYVYMCARVWWAGPVVPSADVYGLSSLPACAGHRICMYMREYVHMCVSVYIYVYVRICVYVCICVCISVFMCVYICVCVYM